MKPFMPVKWTAISTAFSNICVKFISYVSKYSQKQNQNIAVPKPLTIRKYNK